jgi:hypothetical protein
MGVQKYETKILLFVSWEGEFIWDGKREFRDSNPTDLFPWGGVGIVREFCFKMKTKQMILTVHHDL